MSITDELRGYVQSWRETPNLMDDLDAGDIDGLLGDLEHIAGHIDAEHKKACDGAWDNGYEADYLGIEKWLTEHPQVMEHHGWVRLPLDADGEPIHVGDWMTPNGMDTGFKVRQMHFNGEWSLDLKGFGISQTCPDMCRHHHAPTVEDVLMELLNEAEHFHSLEEERDAIAQYAAKLRLADDGEEQ